MFTEFKPEFRVSYGTYGLNGWLFQRASGPAPPWEEVPPSYTDMFSMRRTAGVPLLLDCVSDFGSPTDDTPPPYQEAEWRGASSTMTPFCINRHNGNINGLFLDWSVRKVGLKELWTLKWHRDFNTANKWTKAGGVTPTQWPPWMRGFKDY